MRERALKWENHVVKVVWYVGQWELKMKLKERGNESWRNI